MTESQCSPVWKTGTIIISRSPERMTPTSQCSPVWKTGTIEWVLARQSMGGEVLNVVRSGRPEQSTSPPVNPRRAPGSQCSPVWKTGTIWARDRWFPVELSRSQCSPVWKTGTIFALNNDVTSNSNRLNVVRSGRPEQSVFHVLNITPSGLSQCSPVWKTGTIFRQIVRTQMR